MHCQHTGEEEDGWRSVFIGHCDWMLDSAPLRHWLLAVSFRICYRRFPRHSACTRRTSRHATAWRLSGVCLNLIKLEMEFYFSLLIYKEAAGWKWEFLLSSSNAFAHESSRSDKIYIFFLDKCCESFFFFPSAVCQQTALYAQAGKAGARVQVAKCTWILQHYTAATRDVYLWKLTVCFWWKWACSTVRNCG